LPGSHAEAEGFEPLAQTQNPREKQQISETAAQNPAHAGEPVHCSREQSKGAIRAELTEEFPQSAERGGAAGDEGLAEVVKRWGELSTDARARIFAIVAGG
jgi:hypothetical protein